jgi:hypothetical protein
MFSREKDSADVNISQKKRGKVKEKKGKEKEKMES